MHIKTCERLIDLLALDSTSNSYYSKSCIHFHHFYAPCLTIHFHTVTYYVLVNSPLLFNTAFRNSSDCHSSLLILEGSLPSKGFPPLSTICLLSATTCSCSWGKIQREWRLEVCVFLHTFRRHTCNLKFIPKPWKMKLTLKMLSLKAWLKSII